jgi:hypothetical protein
MFPAYHGVASEARSTGGDPRAAAMRMRRNCGAGRADFQYVPANVSTMVQDARAFLRDSSRELQALRVPVLYANMSGQPASAPSQTASVAESIQMTLKDLSFAAAGITEISKTTDGAIAAAKESRMLELVLAVGSIPVAFAFVGGVMAGMIELSSKGKHTKRRAV